MDRSLIGTPAEVRTSITVNGQLHDPPGLPVVTVTRSDGEIVVENAITIRESQGVYKYVLPLAEAGTLDIFTAVFSEPTIGSITTYLEIVGGFLFSVAEAQAMSLGSRGTLGDQVPVTDIVSMRTTVEDTIEDLVGFAMVPRFKVGQFSDTDNVMLLVPYLRSVRWVTIDETSVDLPSVLPRTTVLMGYEHGLDAPPERLRRAALTLAKIWLTSGPVDDRTNTFTSTEGGTFSLVTPGRGGSFVGVPEVDAAIHSYRLMAFA